MFEIGNSLREARLRHGLDLTEAELATKIRAKYLRALEEERFELLPAQTYVKGFLRSYADHLGLDGQLYVDEYNSRYVAGDDEAPVRGTRSAPSRAHRRLESSVVLFALAGIAAATALVVVAWKFGGPKEETIPNLGAAPPVRTNASPRPARAAGGTAWIRLEVSAPRGNSALAVYRGSPSGRLLFGGTLERGKTDTFVGPRLWLNVSNPENVVLRLNGKPVRLKRSVAEPVVLVATRRGIVPAGGA